MFITIVTDDLEHSDVKQPGCLYDVGLAVTDRQLSPGIPCDRNRPPFTGLVEA